MDPEKNGSGYSQSRKCGVSCCRVKETLSINYDPRPNRRGIHGPCSSGSAKFVAAEPGRKGFVPGYHPVPV